MIFDELIKPLKLLEGLSKAAYDYHQKNRHPEIKAERGKKLLDRLIPIYEKHFNKKIAVSRDPHGNGEPSGPAIRFIDCFWRLACLPNKPSPHTIEDYKKAHNRVKVKK